MNITANRSLSDLCALVHTLARHAEYDHCLSLAGAGVHWDALRHTQPYSAVVVDLDQFHAFNHSRGRAEANAAVGRWLGGFVRDADIVAGAGDEFVVVVPRPTAAAVAVRLLTAMTPQQIYGTATIIALDHATPLVPQIERGLERITTYKRGRVPIDRGSPYAPGVSVLVYTGEENA